MNSDSNHRRKGPFWRLQALRAAQGVAAYAAWLDGRAELGRLGLAMLSAARQEALRRGVGTPDLDSALMEAIAHGRTVIEPPVLRWQLRMAATSTQGEP